MASPFSEMVLILVALIAVISFIGWRVCKKRLRQLEYICMTNSKRLRFYHCEGRGMLIEVSPRSGKKWAGSVNEVYRAFASPTGWEARDSIYHKQKSKPEIKDDDYQLGGWREELDK